jgi:hypothetical protein
MRITGIALALRGPSEHLSKGQAHARSEEMGVSTSAPQMLPPDEVRSLPPSAVVRPSSDGERLRSFRPFEMRESGPERNPNTGVEGLIEALLEPVARRARREALEATCG